MILVTGATGEIGTALIPKLIAEGHEVRALVRDPRRLGSNRVRVQLSLADVGDPRGLRHAVRGADTIIHLAAAIRDQPTRSLEEVNAFGTHYLVRAAQAAGVKRFVFFSAIGASISSPVRLMRSKAVAEDIVAASSMETVIARPSIVYDRDDRFVTMMRRASVLPGVPIAGNGRTEFEPIWSDDLASAAVALLDADPGRYELAGPEKLTYSQMIHLIVEAAGRRRPMMHLPMPLVRAALGMMSRYGGERALLTREEIELMEVPMLATDGAAGMRSLGIEPHSMRTVLQGRA